MIRESAVFRFANGAEVNVSASLRPHRSSFAGTFRAEDELPAGGWPTDGRGALTMQDGRVITVQIVSVSPDGAVFFLPSAAD